jgi:ATP-binding cassette subfamily B multidrug efflux pump
MKIRALLIASLKRHGWKFILGMFFTLGNVWVFLRIPIVVGHTLDHLEDRLLLHALEIVGLALASVFFLFAQRLVIITASRWVEFDLRNDFFSHLMTIPARRHRQWRVGDLMALAVNDLQAVRMAIGPAFMYTVGTLATMVIAVIQMAQVNPMLTLVALSPLPLIATLTHHYGKKIHESFAEIQTQYAFMSGVLQEDLTNIRQLQGFAKEGVFESRFGVLNRDYFEKNKVLIRLTAYFYPLLRFFVALGFMLILFYGGLLLRGDVITFGQFTEFYIYLARLVWPMIAFGWVVNMVQRGFASAKRVEAILQVQPDTPPALPGPVPQGSGVIAVKNLSGGILKDISLEVRPGTWVGIAGPSGSGKTTLLHYLARVEEPGENTIFLDGIDIRRIPLSVLYDRLGCVPQESFLFSATLAENVAFGKPESGTETIRRVTRVAGLHADLEGFPGGLDTLVGEKGVTLSGGQRQRIAIARVLLKAPQILILDDCLSSVDVETERFILRQLREKFRSTTTIIASHRMKVFTLVDYIYVMEQGRIIASGSHETLLETCPLYSRLWELQQLEEELRSHES